MNRAELAALLASAEDEAGRLALLGEHAALADSCLAHVLKDICLDAWSREPARAVGAAEEFLKSARERFVAAGDQRQVTLAENSLATNYTFLHDFRRAEELYRQAYARAEEAGLAATQAEIEASMGNLALFRGRYREALDLLERSRRRYSTMGMPHQSAVAELELADAYLELNLATEALAIYERALPQVAERCHTSLGLLAAARGESAKAEESFGRAVALIEDLRAPLPAEEFRTAFVADKLAPYDELMRLCLADPAGGRVAEALAYAGAGGGLLAFVVADEGVEVVQGLAGEREVSEALGQFRFQIGALRHGSARVRAHLPTLEARARQHLRALYDLLLRRIEPRAGSRRLIVVPHRALHYVPFHALHDGESYLVERREVSSAPTAG